MAQITVILTNPQQQFLKTHNLSISEALDRYIRVFSEEATVTPQTSIAQQMDRGFSELEQRIINNINTETEKVYNGLTNQLLELKTDNKTLLHTSPIVSTGSYNRAIDGEFRNLFSSLSEKVDNLRSQIRDVISPSPKAFTDLMIKSELKKDEEEEVIPITEIQIQDLPLNSVNKKLFSEMKQEYETYYNQQSEYLSSLHQTIDLISNQRMRLVSDFLTRKANSIPCSICPKTYPRNSRRLSEI
jgi:hypothetical protein